MFDSYETTVSEVFYKPLKTALDKAKSSIGCSSYSDETHLIGGVNRVLSDHRSGRAWLQAFNMIFKVNLLVDLFFKALRSKRRSSMVKEVCQLVVDDSLCSDDLFESVPELKKYAIYASDGHALAHSSHEEQISGKKRASNHIFALNLRTHLMEHVDLCLPESGKAKKHEVSTLKTLAKKELRMRQPKGVKVVHVYDPAIVDYRFWLSLKQSGIYIVSLEKKNSSFFGTGELLFDKDDPRNIGVLSDQYIATSNGVMLRRVEYRDPVSGRIYKFLTTITDSKVPPGALAFIYKCRWNIEKAFDQSKNRFMERKSWGKSEESKASQANFICLAHNLCVLLENQLKSDENIIDSKALVRLEKRKAKEANLALLAGRKMNALVASCRKVTQRSCQFIRWLRHCIDFSTRWSDSLETLRPLMLKYLQ